MTDDLRLAQQAAMRGAAVAMRYFAALAGLRREHKVDGSVVTEADRAVERTIRAELAAARPGDTVLGEEGGVTVGNTAEVTVGNAKGVAGGTAGGVAGGTAGGVAGGTAGGVAGGTAGGVAGGTAGGVAGGTAGGVAGGTAGGVAGGTVEGVVGVRRWIIDPIDGTALFVEGIGRWLVLLALELNGEIEVGVAVVPAQRRIWWARRGAGAYEAEIDAAVLDAAVLGAAGPAAAGIGVGRRIAVAPVRPGGLAASRLGVLPVFDDPATGANVVPKAPAVAAPLLTVTPARPWTLHPPLAVARGDLDLAVQTSGQVWDFAATALIVTEAGGTYRGLDGRRRPGGGPSVFARDPDLAEAAVHTLTRPTAPGR